MVTAQCHSYWDEEKVWGLKKNLESHWVAYCGKIAKGLLDFVLYPVDCHLRLLTEAI